MHSKLLTPKEAAAYLGVPASQLKRFRMEGGGPAFTQLSVGGRIGHPRYMVEDLDAWHDSLTKSKTHSELKEQRTGGAS